MADLADVGSQRVGSSGGGRTQRLADSQAKKAATAAAQAAASAGGQANAHAGGDEDEEDTIAPSQQPALKQSPLDFVEWGPPPDMKQRELIFDSLNKIVSGQPQKSGYNGKASSSATGSGKGDSRGTYIFTWGAGYHGQLGRKFVRGQKKYSAIPMMVEMPNVIRQVTCGGLHTAVVTEEGKVYTFGDGRKGELGHIHDPSLKQTPRQVEMLDHVFITSIACGGSHTVAIAENGQLYSWGWARYGQLGHGDRTSQKFPKKIDHPLVKDIVQVACGNKHTMAITKSGQALAFGANRHGQCGLGDFEDRLEPCRIEALSNEPMGYVSCGAIHSALVTASGEVYICGFGEYFTANEAQHFFPQPKKVDLPEPIRTVSCGQAHNLALSVNNNVYAFGSGEYGQCGFGIKGNSSTPRLVLDTRNIRQVSAGRYHSFALTDSGILYSWGCGENGQLGLNSDENILLPTVVTPILGTVVGQVSCGEHHTAILTSAPWTKLSPDVHEWLHAAKVEHELKELYLKKTHRGLTTKDLAKLAIEKERWRESNERHKKELEEEEKQYIEQEMDSVQFEKELQEEVLTAFQKAEKERLEKTGGASSSSHPPASSTSSMKRLNLPPVNDASKDADEEEEKTRAGGERTSTVTRLPTLGTKKLNKPASQASLNASGSQTERHAQSNSSMMALAQTAPLDGAMTVRLDRVSSLDYQATQRSPSHADTRRASYSLLPSARTQFLKETAGMIKHMTAVVHDKGEAQSQRELSETLQQVFAFRKEYDTLKHQSRALQKRAADLKREADLLENSQHSSSDSKEDSDVRLQNLQMQLNTVTIKIAETSENRRNYELNIAHLKEEDFEHFNQLKALRKQNTDTNLYVKKMDDLRTQSQVERLKSEQELQSFRQEVSAYQKFVTEQLAQFEGILKIVRAQNEKRELAKKDREERQTANVAHRVEALTTEQVMTEKESGSLSNRLLSLDLKLRHFEDSFQKISSATGLNHPDAIVNKFFFKGEIREQLQSEIDEKQHQLELLRKEESNLRTDLETIKHNWKDQTWRDVENLSENTREISTRSEKSQKEIERVTQRLAFVQEGLLYLMKNVETQALATGTPGSPTHSGNTQLIEQDQTIAALENGGNLPDGGENAVKGLWTPAQSTTVFAKLDSTVDLLFSALSREQEHRHVLELSAQQRQASQAAANQKNERGSGQQPKMFGFMNIKHLRMLSQQNQMVDQQLSQSGGSNGSGSSEPSPSNAGQ